MSFVQSIELNPLDNEIRGFFIFKLIDEIFLETLTSKSFEHNGLI